MAQQRGSGTEPWNGYNNRPTYFNPQHPSPGGEPVFGAPPRILRRPPGPPPLMGQYPLSMHMMHQQQLQHQRAPPPPKKPQFSQEDFPILYDSTLMLVDGYEVRQERLSRPPCQFVRVRRPPIHSSSAVDHSLSCMLEVISDPDLLDQTTRKIVGTMIDQLNHSNGRRKRVDGQEEDGRLCVSEESMPFLNKNHIVEIVERSDSFPDAVYYCQLCDYHIASINHVRSHIESSSHLEDERRMRDRSELVRRIPEPSAAHLEAIRSTIMGQTQSAAAAEDINSAAQEDNNSAKEPIRVAIRSTADILVENTIPSIIRAALHLEPDSEVVVKLYGSVLTGCDLGPENSDINILIDVPSVDVSNSIDTMKHIHVALRQYQKTRSECEVDAVFRSDAYPCILLTLDKTRVRLSWRNYDNYEMSRLLKTYVSIRKETGELMTVVRRWAKESRLDNSDRARPGLCRLGFDLMVVHFLQKKGLLPVLHELYGCQSSSDDTVEKDGLKLGKLMQDLDIVVSVQSANYSGPVDVAELFVAFLRHYTADHNEVVQIVSSKVISKDFTKWNRKSFHISEPFSKDNVVQFSKAFQCYFFNCFLKSFVYFAVPRSVAGPAVDLHLYQKLGTSPLKKNKKKGGALGGTPASTGSSSTVANGAAGSRGVENGVGGASAAVRRLDPMASTADSKASPPSDCMGANQPMKPKISKWIENQLKRRELDERVPLADDLAAYPPLTPSKQPSISNPSVAMQESQRELEVDERNIMQRILAEEKAATPSTSSTSSVAVDSPASSSQSNTVVEEESLESTPKQSAAAAAESTEDVSKTKSSKKKKKNKNKKKKNKNGSKKDDAEESLQPHLSLPSLSSTSAAGAQLSTEPAAEQGPSVLSKSPFTTLMDSCTRKQRIEEEVDDVGEALRLQKLVERLSFDGIPIRDLRPEDVEIDDFLVYSRRSMYRLKRVSPMLIDPELALILDVQSIYSPSVPEEEAEEPIIDQSVPDSGLALSSNDSQSDGIAAARLVMENGDVEPAVAGMSGENDVGEEEAVDVDGDGSADDSFVEPAEDEEGRYQENDGKFPNALGDPRLRSRLTLESCDTSSEISLAMAACSVSSDTSIRAVDGHSPYTDESSRQPVLPSSYYSSTSAPPSLSPLPDVFPVTPSNDVIEDEAPVLPGPPQHEQQQAPPDFSSGEQVCFEEFYINSPPPQRIEELITQKTAGWTASQFDYSFCIPFNFTNGYRAEFKCSFCDQSDHAAEQCPNMKLPSVEEFEPLSKKQLRELDDIILANHELKRVSEHRMEELQSFVNSFETELRKGKQLGEEVRLEIFGSLRNGFGSDSSDVDICFRYASDEPPPDKRVESTLNKIKFVALQMESIQNVQAICHAKVPIVKFDVVKKGRKVMEGDISYYNVLALTNTQLLNTYCQWAPDRLPQLGMWIKRWAKQCDIGDASRGSLSSYSYIILLIHFAQNCQPPLLPRLQQDFRTPETQPILVDGWDVYFHRGPVDPKWSKNKQSVGELFLSFLDYYCNFDFDSQVIQIRQSKELTKCEKSWKKPICLEDPFDRKHNLGVGVSHRMSVFIRSAFIRSRIVFRCGEGLKGTVPPELAGSGSVDKITKKQIMAHHFEKLTCGMLTICSNSNGKAPLDRNCRICHKVGHYQENCTARNAKRDAMVCHICKASGHMMYQCPRKGNRGGGGYGGGGGPRSPRPSNALNNAYYKSTKFGGPSSGGVGRGGRQFTPRAPSKPIARLNLLDE